MGGEGHMLDMIKKLELNRAQRKDAVAGRFKSFNKPAMTEKYLRDIENFEIEKPKELSHRQKRIYQVLAITSLAIIIGFAVFLLLILFLRQA